MTVAELIDLLRQHPMDMPVYTEGYDGLRNPEPEVEDVISQQVMRGRMRVLR